jgi:GrpB-like predicted nucleotidyltransferase (UPF0157 family)
MSEHSSSLDRAIGEDVVLSPYQLDWPQRCATERARLMSLFASRLLRIEHFGSTAIPGMPAKPIIDVLTGVASMAAADSRFEPILESGYTTSREFNAMLPDRRWFMRSSGGRRTHHLHVVVSGSRMWHERLVFRDKLRSSAMLAKQYGDLKLELASRFKHDREAYTDAKSEFVAYVLALAGVNLVLLGARGRSACARFEKLDGLLDADLEQKPRKRRTGTSAVGSAHR